MLSLEHVDVGIWAICIFGDSATAENFQVRTQILYHTLDNSQLSKAIEALRYQVVITSPEQLMKVGGPWQRLLRSWHFSSMIISIIFDEGHCIDLGCDSDVFSCFCRKSSLYGHQNIIYIYSFFIYKMGHFPSNHHCGPFCLQMFDARPYGRVKRLKISDIKISHQPSRISPSRIFLGLFTLP